MATWGVGESLANFSKYVGSNLKFEVENWERNLRNWNVLSLYSLRYECAMGWYPEYLMRGKMKRAKLAGGANNAHPKCPLVTNENLANFISCHLSLHFCYIKIIAIVNTASRIAIQVTYTYRAKTRGTSSMHMVRHETHKAAEWATRPISIVRMRQN
jgi:hypothetical protein